VAAQLTGWNPQALYAAVEAGHPVLVWTTVDYAYQTPRTWAAWDGRIIPWTEAGHVVVLMGVDPSARTLEFSDPLTGSYNGTTMAQFARTFTIYGSMAIVIERTAKGAPPRPTPVHQVVVQGTTAVPLVTVLPATKPVAWAPIYHVRTTSVFSSEDSAGVAAASVGLLAGATSISRGLDVAPLLGVALLLVVAAAILLAVLERRRRRQCAG
jgi:hypothetical protein